MDVAIDVFVKNGSRREIADIGFFRGTNNVNHHED